MEKDTPENDNPSTSSPELTPNDFLRLRKDEVEEVIAESLPEASGEFFTPASYAPATSLILQKMKSWKGDYTAKAQERKQILNWIVPLAFVGPGLVAVIWTGGLTPIAAITFTSTTMITIAFLWFFGRIWRWEEKRYEANVQYADKAIERIRHQKARAWAAGRYDLDTQGIEWAEFSDFYIDHHAYRWKELDEGEFIIIDAETGEEAPRRD